MEDLILNIDSCYHYCFAYNSFKKAKNKWYEKGSSRSIK